jgi:predicted GTPase
MSLIQKRKKGLVILVNKWDLMKKETNTARDFEKTLERENGTIYGCTRDLYLST